MTIKISLFAGIVLLTSLLHGSAKDLDETCEYLLDKKKQPITYRQALTTLVNRAVDVDDQAVLNLLNFDIHGNPKVVMANYKNILQQFELTVRFEGLLSKCSFGYKVPELEEERGPKSFQMSHDVRHGLYLVKRNIEGHFYAQQAAKERYLQQQRQLYRQERNQHEPIAITSANKPKNIGRHYGKRKGHTTHRPSKYF